MAPSANLNFRQIQVLVHQSIKAPTVTSIVTFCAGKSPSFWGEHRPQCDREFCAHNVYLALFHFLTGKGYDWIAFNINFEYPIQKGSLRHNITVLAPILAEWGRSKVVLGGLNDWKAATATIKIPDSLKGVNLWMDSTDVHIQGIKKIGKKSDNWSFKLNKPGLRYMCALNGHGCVIKYWGAYSPKTHDGTFINSLGDEFGEIFRGAGIIADNHFGICSKFFKNKVNFFTNKSLRNGKKLVKGVDSKEDFASNLTKADQKFNKEHQALRARVESVFSWIKQHFKILDQGWRESHQRLNWFMAFAIGLFNVAKRGL